MFWTFGVFSGEIYEIFLWQFLWQFVCNVWVNSLDESRGQSGDDSRAIPRAILSSISGANYSEFQIIFQSSIVLIDATNNTFLHIYFFKFYKSFKLVIVFFSRTFPYKVSKAVMSKVESIFIVDSKEKIVLICFCCCSIPNGWSKMPS